MLKVREAVSRRQLTRQATGVPWLDVMLGGGFVGGSVVLLHGEPGAGKSTALAQAAAGVPGSLYVCLEEDVRAVADRVVRLGLRDDMDLLAEPDIEVALREAVNSPLVILDSLQLVEGKAVDAVKVAVAHARRWNTAVVLVCHETKGGVHAGARAIEHLVDVTVKVGRGPPRYIATEKNRFGVAGVWLPLEMTERGFVCTAR
jgi:DNA repair protein RadA/Sms